MVHHSGEDVYFGWSGDAEGTVNWIYDPETHQWRRITPHTGVPPTDGVQHSKLEYDAQHDLIVLCRQTDPQWYAMRLCL
jgi:hypothetical protein